MSMTSDLVDRLRVESKSMGKYGVDYMATLLVRSADTIEMLSEKARADRPQGEWLKFGLGRGTRILFCTNCERRIEVPLSLGDSNYDFCPNCGAKMKGADDEQGRSFEGFRADAFRDR